MIPCHLLIECLDPQAMDVLASPKTIDVRLLRHIKYFPDPTLVIAGRHVAPVVDTQEVERAIWWENPNTVPQGPYERIIEGEIHLPIALQPPTDFKLFTIEVHIPLSQPEPFLFWLTALHAVRCEPVSIPIGRFCTTQSRRHHVMSRQDCH